ncbi:hypothetical protein EUZ93_01505 [Wolbachia pipientis]|nr:hypothetical protein [Wolbachia pipientis]
MYNEKMIDILSDSKTYTQIGKNPIKIITNQARTLLNRWKSEKFINDSSYKYLYVSDGSLPRAYGLPKIHKEGNPLRLIVSCINSPNYKLANFIKNILNKSIDNSIGHIKDSLINYVRMVK